MDKYIGYKVIMLDGNALYKRSRIIMDDKINAYVKEQIEKKYRAIDEEEIDFDVA